MRYAPHGVMQDNRRTVHDRIVSDFCIVGHPDTVGVVVELPTGINRYLLQAQSYIDYMTAADAPPIELLCIFDTDNLEPIEVKSLAELLELMKEEEQTVEAPKKEVAEPVAKSGGIDWEQFRAAAALGLMQTMLSAIFMAGGEVDDDGLVKLSVSSADKLVEELRKES